MADTAIIEITQYLTFKPAEEIFAVDVARVREILKIPAITRIPCSRYLLKNNKMAHILLCYYEISIDLINGVYIFF
jgi:hypothetical protein